MSVVYFVASPSTQMIKIGFSRGVERRLTSLQMACGTPLALICTVPGNRTDEARLHRRFLSERTLGEWFKDGGKLRAFVDRLVASDEAARIAAINEELHPSTPEDMAWVNEVNEILHDACFALIRKVGVEKAAEALTRRWGDAGRPVRPQFLAAVLDGRNYMRAEWLPWCRANSGAVRDALDLMFGGTRGTEADREMSRYLWRLRTSLRREFGDERADEIINAAEMRE